MVQQRDPWEVPEISPKQREAAGKATITEADAAYATRKAKADAERAEAEAAAAQAGLPQKQQAAALNLTPGQQKVDEKFSQSYIDWVSGGEYAGVVNQLKQLEAAVNLLKSGKTISGPIAGRLPPLIQQVLYGDDPKAVAAKVNKVTVGSLRTILGSQFTDAEGKRISEMSYDPTVSPETNIDKIKSGVDELIGRAMAMQAAAKYFGEKGTLAGYTGVNPLTPGTWGDDQISEAQRDFEKIFGAEKVESPYETVEKLKPTTETEVGAGETYVSAEAKRLAADLDKAWREGATVEEIIAMNPGIDRKALAEAEKYRNLEEPVYAKFAPYESERPLSEQIKGAILDNPVTGPVAAFAAKTAPTYAMPSIAEAFGGDPEGLQFALDYMNTKYPIASNLGTFTGEAGRSILGTAGLTRLGMNPLTAALTTETVLGGTQGGFEAPKGETLAGTLVGGGEGAAIGSVPFAASRVLNPNTPEAVRAMRKSGVDMSVGQTLGIPELEASVAKVLPGGGDIALSAQRKSFDDFQRAYLDEAGKSINASPLDKTLKPTERFATAQKAFNDAYEKAKANLQVAPDPEFDAAVAEFRGKLRNGVDFDPANAKRLEKLLDDTVVRRISGKPSGDTYKSLDSLLSKRRASFAKGQQAELADGVADLQKIIRDNAVRNSSPEAVKALDDVDTGYSYLIRGEEAAAKGSTPAGEFSPQQLLNAVQKGDLTARNRAFARGEARGQEFAEQGVEALGKGSPTGATPTERAVGSVGTPFGGFLPNMGVGGVNLPGVRPVINTMIAGERPEFMRMAGESIAARPAYLSAPSAAGGDVAAQIEGTAPDISSLLSSYGYTPATEEDTVRVGASPTPAQRFVMEAAAPKAAEAATETDGLGVAIGEAAPTVTLGGMAAAQNDGLVKIGNVTAKLDPATDEFVDLATGRRVKELADFLEPVATYAGDPVRGKYRGGPVRRFNMGGQVTLADLAQYYGMRR